MKWLNDYTIITAGIVLVIAMGFGLAWLRPVVAAPPSDLAECVPFAKAATIIFYRCEDDETGLIIYANSMGFMQVSQ